MDLTPGIWLTQAATRSFKRASETSAIDKQARYIQLLTTYPSFSGADKFNGRERRKNLK
jgi:hypothetical protein